MVKIVDTNEFSKIENSNGVVVIDFFANWCGPCKMLAPVFEEISEELTPATFVKVDIDNSLELAKKYSVTSIPTVIVLKDGAVAERKIGFIPKDNLKSMIQNHL